jgi:AraC-like DNA-binding protein
MHTQRVYYLNAGRRRYDRHPIAPYRRDYWEFQAVLRGRIGAVTVDAATDWGSRSLWVFAPDCSHGWTGQPGREATILVFHLPRPDALLVAEAGRRGGMIRIALSRADGAWLEQQHADLRQDYRQPNESSALKVAHLLSGLAILLLRGCGYQPRADFEQVDRERVERARYWYRQNLEQNPGVEQVARAVGVSGVHLRRLFARVAGESPKRAFQAIRMEQARAVLQSPHVTVDAVAARFGFADASSFTRAFRAQFGHPPRRVESRRR